VKTIGIGAFVVALVMMAIGTAAGLSGNHEAAIPAIVMSFAALAAGVFLLRD
jgi:hypothetical protein